MVLRISFAVFERLLNIRGPVASQSNGWKSDRPGGLVVAVARKGGKALPVSLVRVSAGKPVENRCLRCCGNAMLQVSFETY